jgi:hypothetical protein
MNDGVEGGEFPWIERLRRVPLNFVFRWWAANQYRRRGAHGIERRADRATEQT